MGEWAQWAAILSLAGWAGWDRYQRHLAAQRAAAEQSDRRARFLARVAGSEGGRALLRARLAAKAGG